MKKTAIIILLATISVAAGLWLVFFRPGNIDHVQFNAQIRPILNKNCITCHGGVKRSGGFSLLFREDAMAVNKSGKRAIVPGDPDASEMIRRITSHDPEVRMPAEKEPLPASEIELLTRWIREGAPWQDHWAYVKPAPVQPPDYTSEWCRNEIDRFVLRKLREHDLQPAPEADKATLLRRVSFDLTGLPPTPGEVRRFLHDPSPDAYAKVVDRLLDAPQYGEKWASVWLDLARYADSKGYEADNHRTIWQYRDWVIRSFNDDKPYDRFIVEQLAGDLLPHPTDDQRIATAFHRNSMNNDEGGTDDEEFRVAAVMDRVSTTWSALQATTMQCVQCHSHPYDPIRHEDYYKFFAFFNNSADEDVPGEYPNLKTFTSSEDVNALADIKTWISAHTPAAERDAETARVVDLVKLTAPKIKGHSFDSISKGTLDGFKNLAVENGGSARLKDVPLNGAANMLVHYRAPANTGRVELRLDDPRGNLLATWHVKKNKTGRAFETVSIPLQPAPGKHDVYFIFRDPAAKGYICTIEWVLFYDGLPGRNSAGYEVAEQKIARLLNATDVIETPVMVELPEGYRRKTYVFERGNWMVHGDEVAPGVPDAWNPMPPGAPPNRLGMARWLVSKDNPLTARVMVNRLWAQLFGKGIVETLEDFGSQGAPPSHPQLLDWMARRFMYEDQWSIKRMLRTIVMSATYRQSSRVSATLAEIDPDNRLLARGPRVRLSAEEIRDQALRVSGLLSDKMYGPSVMPPQPEGVWQVARSRMEWKTSEGQDKHRRALYTFWRRASPYPSMISFDSPSREFCVARRINTNTPIQALVLLNDPVYVEAAKALAARMFGENKTAPVGRIRWGYCVAMAREEADAGKIASLEALYEKALQHFKQDPAAAESMTGKVNLELAALTVVANAILNLDEFITKA